MTIREQVTPEPAPWERLFILALLLMVPFVIPVLLDFGTHNDYSVFSYENHRCCLGYPESQHLFFIGRPLGALLLNVQLLPVDEIGDFRWLRLISCMLVVLLFLGVARLLCREAPERSSESTLAAFSITLLPAPLLYVVWATNAVPGLVALLLAVAAYFLIARAWESQTRYRIASAVLGGALLQASFYVYPPGSFCFLLFPSWRALMTRKLAEASWRWRTLTEFCVVVFASALYFLSLKIIATPQFVAAYFDDSRPKPSGVYGTSLAGGLGERMGVFADYVARSFGMWMDGWLNDPVSVLSFAIVVLLVLAIQQISEKRSFFVAAGRVAVPCAAFLMAAAPVVASSGGFATTRNVFVGSALAAMTLLAVVLNFLNGKRRVIFGRVGLYCVCFVSLSASTARLAGSAFNANLELNFVRKEMLRVAPDTEAVVLYPPVEGGQILSGLAPPDFRLLASASMLDGLPLGVLREMGFGPRNLAVSYRTRPSGIHVDHTIEICMDDARIGDAVNTRSLCRDAADTFAHRPDAATVDVRGLEHAAPALVNAFDGATGRGSYWETSIATGVILDLRYPHAQAMNEYRFSSGPERTERMPISWNVRASHDGIHWVLLESHTERTPWMRNETRAYVLNPKVRFERYAFEFDKALDERYLRVYEMDFRVEDPAVQNRTVP